MNYLDWHVGMKVVCVDASTRNYDPPRFRSLGTDLSGIEEGRIYTVREILDFYGMVGVRLQGIIRPLSRLGLEVPYAAARFRPVQTRKTDISVFEAMLTGAKPKVPA
jgi:hypothetical protein